MCNILIIVVTAEPVTSEVTAASIVPEKTEETKPKKSKTEKNPESRKKALARKRQRMLIAGSLFVSHSRPRSKKKKPVTKVVMAKTCKFLYLLIPNF